MRLKPHGWSVLLATGIVGLVGMTVVAAAGEQFLPVLSFRQGALRFLGIPLANGFIDYVTLLNTRDGGINGMTLVWEECETVYDVTRGVECYERLKTKGPTGAAAFQLANTPLTYVFTAPSTYWSQNTAKLRFIGQRAGGMEQLKDMKIVHVYHDSDLGRETIP